MKNIGLTGVGLLFFGVVVAGSPGEVTEQLRFIGEIAGFVGIGLIALGAFAGASRK